MSTLWNLVMHLILTFAPRTFYRSPPFYGPRCWTGYMVSSSIFKKLPITRLLELLPNPAFTILPALRFTQPLFAPDLHLLLVLQIYSHILVNPVMLLAALRTDAYGRVKVDERILWGGLAVGMALFLSGGLTALHFCSKKMRDGGQTIDTFVKHKTLRFVMRGRTGCYQYGLNAHQVYG